MITKEFNIEFFNTRKNKIETYANISERNVEKVKKEIVQEGNKVVTVYETGAMGDVTCGGKYSNE